MRKRLPFGFRPLSAEDPAHVLTDHGVLFVKSIHGSCSITVDFNDRLLMVLYILDLPVKHTRIFLNDERLHKWKPMRLSGITHNSTITVVCPYTGGGKAQTKKQHLKRTAKPKKHDSDTAPPSRVGAASWWLRDFCFALSGL